MEHGKQVLQSHYLCHEGHLFNKTYQSDTSSIQNESPMFLFVHPKMKTPLFKTRLKSGMIFETLFFLMLKEFH